MKFVCEKDKILKAINSVTKAVAVKEQQCLIKQIRSKNLQHINFKQMIMKLFYNKKITR